MIQNTKGSAILSAVVGATISSLIGLMTYRMIHAQLHNQQLIGANSERTMLRAQIQGMLSEPTACSKVLQDLKGNEVKYNPDALILPGSKGSLAQIGMQGFTLSRDGMMRGGLRIRSHKLIEMKDLPRTLGFVNKIPSLRVHAILTIETDKYTYGSQIISPMTLEFPLRLELDASSGLNRFKILECSTRFARDTATTEGPKIVTSVLSTSNVGAGGNCNSSLENAGRLYLLAIGSPYALAIALKRVHTATVYCPKGTKVIGGGAQCGAGFTFGSAIGALTGNSAGSMLASEPTPDGNGWAVACCVEGLVVQKTNAYAICVNEPE